ncbi:MAG TPA: hypothetical protein VF773_14545 [Verrucomicrobiae bacterium]
MQTFRAARKFGLVAVLFLAGICSIVAAEADLKVTAPPDSFFELVRDKYRDKARVFYRKHLNISGLSVAAAGEVDDHALRRTHEIVRRMLAGRPDVLGAMVKNGMYLIIIGKDQVYTDMPEYSDHPNPAYQNERVRGTGGKPTSFGEENLLSLPVDRYDDESIGVHEFCHTIDGTLRSIDPTWTERRNTVYRKALDAGLWKNSYAASNPGEFWAEVAQSYFDCNRVNNWNHGPIGTREQLKVYDSEAYELVRTAFNLKPEQDWRYTWLQPLPNIIAPPAKFRIDPHYTKFTYARELPVVGRGASDAALLKANNTVRKMFAYRHDILKALINDGVKLVVLGKSERLSDLPELRTSEKLDLLARFLDYSPEHKLIVVAEENVLGDTKHPLVGDYQVIYLLAKATVDLCANRAVDPDWEKRGREVQQYELRVQRLDTRFKERLEKLASSAGDAKKWAGTPALRSPAEYFARGVLAYFNASGETHAPSDAPFPISTREQLRDYDPDFYKLISETLAYESHVDWSHR